MLKQAYKSILSKLALNLMLILAFVVVQSVLFSSQAKAAVPYTYTLERENDENIIKITFDKGIDVDSINEEEIENKVTIAAVDEVALAKTPEILEMNVINASEIDITVSDLDPDVVDYQITIPAGVIVFDTYTQLSNFIIAFSSSDFGDGFEDVFIDQSASELNENVFKYNGPRDVNIYIPKRYITKIETIHKYNGVSDSTSSSSVPKLTNIDVYTVEDVKKMTINITNSKGTTTIMETKILNPRTDFKGFNLGESGLKIETSTTYKVNIKAYDVNGKLVDERTIVPKIGSDKTTDYTISDYISSTSSSSKSDKSITLYTLMSDTKTLTYALTNFNKQLNLIKVGYSNTSDYRVIKDDNSGSSVLNILANAISDDDVRYIKFYSALTITLPQDITISKSNSYTDEHVIIEGNGTTINGNVTIGNGSSDTNIYELRNLTINGTLTINLSDTSNCVSTNVLATTVN